MFKHTALALAAVLSFVACGSKPDSNAIKVGAIFAFTGATSDVGTIYADGIRGHVDWLNSRGGIEGRPVDLLFQDYGYRVDRAEQLYSQFVGEGAVVFMGWGTGDTEALIQRVAEDRIPFMSASYSHVLGDPEEAPYNFLVGTTYSHQFLILLDWFLERHGEPPRVAVLHHASPFGLSPIAQLGRAYASSKGIELLTEEMPRGSTDYTAELTRVREWGADYVIFQNTSGPVALALRNAQDIGLKVGFGCLNWCTNELLVELAGAAADGVVGSMLFSPPSGDIQGLEDASEYLSAHGSSLEDKGVLYGQGWVTMAVMVEGIRRALDENPELTGERIKAALEGIRELDTGGVTVPITFDEGDHRGAKGMRLYRVESGRWVAMTDFVTAIEP